MTAPRAPRELQASGRRLWRAVQDEYQLEEHERQLLLEMARTADALDRLAAIVALEGDLIVGANGARKMHPAAVEARHLKVAYARISAALRLPAGEEGDDLRRPQRRVGVRGIYAVRG